MLLMSLSLRDLKIPLVDSDFCGERLHPSRQRCNCTDKPTAHYSFTHGFSPAKNNLIFNPQFECDCGGLRSLSVRLPRAEGLVLGYLGD